MSMTVYQPSPKGIKRGFTGSERIVFINEHYVWLEQIDTGYKFETGEYDTGDAFEWKPKFKKPDSLWKAVDEIDPSTITGLDRLSDYNLKANEAELKEMGLIS